MLFKAFGNVDAFPLCIKSKDVDEIVNTIYLISGSYDLLVTIEGRTLREAAQFVSDKLSPLESVLSTKTNFILKKYKDHGTIMAEKEKDERMLMTP